MALGIEPILLTLYSFYNVVFQPILALGPYIALGIFSATLAGIFSIIYWYMLDIERMEEVKDKISTYQDKMKEARNNENTEKANEHMQKTMKLNQKMMKLNMKPMIGTMVFVALIFPWLGATFAPAIELTETGENTYTGNFTYAQQTEQVTVINESEGFTVELGEQTATAEESIEAFGVEWEISDFRDDNGGFFSAAKGEILKINAKFIPLPVTLPYIGSALNWLGYYIVIAMPLTYIFRKLLGVA